jgi:hypothetical protein
VVFSPSQRMPDLIHKVMVGVLPVMMTILVLTTVTDLRRPYWALILLHLLGFFVVAMVLHGEVARDRPSARHLTEFYLWVATGGVLGGVFNALIAPVAFDTVVEYPLAIVLACLFVPGAILGRLLVRDPEEQHDAQRAGNEGEPNPGEEDSPREERETLTSSGSPTTGSRRLDLALDLALPLALGLVILAFGWLVDRGTFDPIVERYNVWQIFIGLAAAVCLWFAYASSRPIRFGLGIAALLVAVTFANGAGSILFEDRSFFGVYRVSGDPGTDNAYHALVVGDTNHGAQLLGPQPPTPIAYHDPSGPFGQLFELLPSETTDESPVAVLGLGAGVMSCYAEPGQRWTYYEIDPLVESIARNENLFTYLRDCPGQYDVVLGDARLKLSEAENGTYGMVIGEAFSSDAIPVHMLTREATDMYFEKLNEHGVLVHHISNRHLDLEPVVGDLARDRGLTCYQSYDDLSDTQPSATSQYKLAAHFTVLARDEADLGGVPDDPRWAPCATNEDTDKVWTDDYSNILSTFVFG